VYITAKSVDFIVDKGTVCHCCPSTSVLPRQYSHSA